MSGDDSRLAVFADRTRCCGYGICAQLCPEVFKVDEGGIVVVQLERVPALLADAAREAVASCPQSALRAEEAP